MSVDYDARMHTSVTIAGVVQPIELDFDTFKWHSAQDLPEAEFPLIATVDGERFELYSDGTFDEEELP
jgi:hypothetical protein